MAENDGKTNSYPKEILENVNSISRNLRNSIVVVETPGGDGTGWFISDTGHIVTNEHVVEGNETVTIRLLNGQRFDAHVLGQNKTPDVALLKIEPPHEIRITPLTLGSSANLTETDTLISIGHPGITGYWITTIGGFKRFSYVISTDGTKSTEMITTVPGKQGSSGSPVFDINGKVVGLVYAGQSITPEEDYPPKPSLLAIKQYIIPRSLQLAVTIENVMTYINEWMQISK